MNEAMFFVFAAFSLASPPGGADDVVGSLVIAEPVAGVEAFRLMGRKW
jgi:hypothetical protein